MTTEWTKEAGATLGELFRALGQSEAASREDAWWSGHLDAETNLRLIEGKQTRRDIHRVWDEAYRLRADAPGVVKIVPFGRGTG